MTTPANTRPLGMTPAVTNTGTPASVYKFSIAAWESASQLTPEQNALVNEFQRVCKPPTKTESSTETHSDATNVSYGRALSELLAESPVEKAKNIKDDRQLLTHEFGHSLAHLKYYQGVKFYRDALQQVTDALASISAHIQDLENLHQSVHNKTTEVREECQALLREQKHLVEVADHLRAVLAYFDQADRMAARLDARKATEKLVPVEEFSSSLQRLEEGLDFMKNHSDYRDSRQYLDIYRRLHLRLLNEIKEHFTGAIETTSKEILASKQAAGAVGSDVQLSTDATHSFVAYRALAKQLRPLMADLETRASKLKAYKVLLLQCLHAYFFQRDLLMTADIQSYLAQVSKESDVLNLCRVGCTYLIEINTLEYQLFHDFFGEADQANDVLRELLGKLSAILYTQMRPKIIHEIDLDILCQLVNIVKFEFLEDQLAPRGDVVSAFSRVVTRLLADVQERLSYRAQIYIRDSILGFVPLASDLDYPARLKPLTVADEDSKSAPRTKIAQVLQESGHADAHASWYPTLDRTLMCLSKLYRCLEVSVFQYLAQEAVHACTSTLLAASRTISQKASPTDGLLFLIKHLLVLREQILPFKVDFVVTEQRLDFSHMPQGLPAMFTGLRLTSWSSLVAWVQRSEPKLTDQKTDSRKDMAKELTRACEALIKLETQTLMTPPVRYLTDHQARTAAPTVTATGALPDATVPALEKDLEPLRTALHAILLTLKQGAVGADEKEQAANNVGATSLELRLRTLREKMALYLNNSVHENILLKPIKENYLRILQQTRNFLDRVFPRTDPSLHQLLAELEAVVYTIE